MVQSQDFGDFYHGSVLKIIVPFSRYGEDLKTSVALFMIVVELF